MDKPLWQPSKARIESTNLAAFVDQIADQWGVDHGRDYMALWQWSIDEMEKFWVSFWDFCGIIAETRGERIIVDAEKMPGARFFPGARLNFAQNLLRRRDETIALKFWGEDKVRRQMSWAALYDAASLLAQAFRKAGLKPGDRVAAYMPNMPETIVAMLAASSIGAVFSSCSPDFGSQGVIDRFGQIEPKFLISADGYHYAGKSHSSLDKLPAIIAAMPSIEQVIIVPYLSDAPDVSAVPKATVLPDFVKEFEAGKIVFEQLAFNAPLYIMFSSGTTGVPKCIVHGIGGSLLTHLKEHKLHADIKPGDRLFWFTTCGWMMWNWLASGLASEATLLLYDGSPFHPDGNVVFDFADANDMSFFGTSAKFFDACNKAGMEPGKTHKLTNVRSIGSTGSPLVPEGFDYVYDKIKPDIHLASMSGGTDLLGCFVGSNPFGPVWPGEIQAPTLAMAVDVFNEEGQSVRGEKGELVCTKPFPSLPIGFWNDPDDKRYHAAYFEKYENVWNHGDWIEHTEHDGYIIYGRSDATLNAGGVRIGTAEIYRQVEGLDEIVEGLVIGQDWDNDTRIVLFVRLREGQKLDDALTNKIKKQIRANTTPRHVPARILQVQDIPRTKSGKIVELAVREVVHGRPVKNIDALANPEALKEFEGREELSA
ncbi:MAG: acetoacetate--CoA ligase [Alphaproteobacteria bacterium]|nr:acetoacetate--CoA ligase [Alphaproteobacteria bacterium]